MLRTVAAVLNLTQVLQVGQKWFPQPRVVLANASFGSVLRCFHAFFDTRQQDNTVFSFEPVGQIFADVTLITHKGAAQLFCHLL